MAKAKKRKQPKTIKSVPAKKLKTVLKKLNGMCVCYGCADLRLAFIRDSLRALAEAAE